MTQEERLDYMLNYLTGENADHRRNSFPRNIEDKRRLLRGLMNVRPPMPVRDEFIKIQYEYLKEALEEKGITYLEELSPVREDIYLWQGDITTLAAEAIVNAANSKMLGCFVPCHGCIDNAIHTYGGVQLRLECADIMKKQGRDEKTGGARMTRAYNLPCRYVLHTVGPIISGRLTREDERLLASCYRSCLEAAVKNNIRSLAFCCISTGEFHFPNERAAEIAVDTVIGFQNTSKEKIKVIFNVFKEKDYEIYKRLLGKYKQDKG